MIKSALNRTFTPMNCKYTLLFNKKQNRSYLTKYISNDHMYTPSFSHVPLSFSLLYEIEWRKLVVLSLSLLKLHSILFSHLFLLSAKVMRIGLVAHMIKSLLIVIANNVSQINLIYSLFLLPCRNLLSSNLNSKLLMFKLIGVTNFVPSIIILHLEGSNIDLHVPRSFNRMVLFKVDIALSLNLACTLCPIAQSLLTTGIMFYS